MCDFCSMFGTWQQLWLQRSQTQMNWAKSRTPCPEPWSGPDIASPPPSSRSKSKGWRRFLFSSPIAAGPMASPFPSSQPSLPHLPPLSLPALVGSQVGRFMKDIEGFPLYHKLFVCVCVHMGGSRGTWGEKEESQTADHLIAHPSMVNFMLYAQQPSENRGQFVVQVQTNRFCGKVAKSGNKMAFVTWPWPERHGQRLRCYLLFPHMHISVCWPV